MKNLWRDAAAGKTDIEQLVYLSNLIGGDESLVQPGGGNTSVKLSEPDFFGCETEALVVKGSGTDLRTIDAGGFAHLYVDRLRLLLDRKSMTDEEMLDFMRMCMLHPQRDPLPSVETPLHSVLPVRFIAHTHDVATLSLTDTPSPEEHVRRLYGDSVAFLEYVRPGFPLARRLIETYRDGPPAKAIGLVMEKHGLSVWGETARDCYENLCTVISKAEEFLAGRGEAKRSFGAVVRPPLDETERREAATDIMPVVRGELSRHGWRPVLHFDESPEVLEAIGGERFADVAARGVMTPEHILRAGRAPLVLRVDPSLDHESLKHAVREQFGAPEKAYLAYLRAQGAHEPIADWLKVIAVPGVGLVCAGKDKRSAQVAAVCYRKTLEVMAGAEAVERFQFLSDADAHAVEYWPLERRKVEEGAKQRRDLDGKVALVIGAAGGIGRATALRLAEAGAHVAAADLDAEGAKSLVAEIGADRATALAVDASDEGSIEAAVREAVLHFGGIDVLFYSPGVAPALHPVSDMPAGEVERQLRVHYQGAVAATRAVSRVMLDQGLGGRLVYNASKAAYVPGEGAAAYGASKAALVQYVRNVANELGRYGITANYINADAVDTPLFRRLVAERAKRAGKSEAEMLERYEDRSVFGTATVPPEYVAEAVAWLASDRSAYTTGCVITVGGGTEGFPR